MNKRPILGITMGDPAGNGPELSVKALAEKETYEKCSPLIVGDAACLEKAVKITGYEGKIQIHPVSTVEEALFQYGTIDVFDLKLLDISKHEFGKISPMCGDAAFQYVKKVYDQTGEKPSDSRKWRFG